MAGARRAWTVKFCLLLIVSLLKVSDGEVYSNVAVGKPAKQTNTKWGAGAGRAVDGNRSPSYPSGSCTHTSKKPDRWWVVDLMGLYKIQSVAIVNRNLNDFRLADFSVYISKMNPLPIPKTDGSLIGEICFNHTGAVPASGPHTFYCNEITTGRFVYLHRPTKEYLTICEFEVMGIQIKNEKDQYTLEAGRKSVYSPFHSEVMHMGTKTSCATMCISREENLSTIIQFQESTGLCECILKSSFTMQPTDFVNDSGWTLMMSTNN